MLFSFPWIASVLTFATFISPSLQDNQPSVSWVSPPGAGSSSDYSGNWILKQGDNFIVSFTTQATNFDVVIWQTGVRNPYVIKSNTSVTNFNWTVDTSYFNVPITPHGDITGNVCYFGVTNINNHQEWISTSHYVNLTSPVLDHYFATVSSSASQPTATARSQPANPQDNSQASPSPSTALSPNLSSSSTASMSTMVPNTSNDSDSQVAGRPLTGGQAAGIGVGVALGVLVVAAAIAAFLYRRRQQKLGLERIQSPQRGLSVEDPEKRTWRQASTASAPGPDQIMPTFAHGAGGDGIRLGAGVPLGATTMAQQQRHELGEGTYAEMDGKWSRRELPT